MEDPASLIGITAPAVSQFVIPATSRKTGRKPGSMRVHDMMPFFWIPDFALLRVARPK
jgi:hypothetical protein